MTRSKPKRRALLWTARERSMIRARLNHGISDNTIIAVGDGGGSENSRALVIPEAHSLGLDLPTGSERYLGDMAA